MGPDEIAANILDARAEVLERLFASKLGQELTRLDRAYEALTGHVLPDIVLMAKDAEPIAVEIKTTKRGSRQGSVRNKVHEIIEAEPRLWSYEDLAVELERQGVKVVDDTGKVKSSLRTAVWTLVNEGVAARGPVDGTVYAAARAEEIDQQGLRLDFPKASDLEREVD